ncbi:MAG: phosphatase PAP2 family protein [Lachnospiraceae bacterium]|nr:phosphatase PAP2 family protein [Lachnospiraceae bacterium]
MNQIFDRQRLREIDEGVMRSIQAGRRNCLNPIVIALTHLGGGVIWWAWYVLIFIKTEDKTALLYLSAAFFSAWLLSSKVMKRIFRRPRAYDAMEGLIPLIRRPKDSAFPSAHAACAFSAACAIAFTRSSAEGALALILAVLVGYSRIYVGVHYLTDVIGGAFTGFCCASLAYMLFFF